MVSVSVRYLFQQPMDEKIKTWPLRFPAKEKKTLIWRRHGSTGQSCCSMTWKRGNGWFLESSKGMKFFHPSVLLTNQSHARLYPFEKPIKSLYFRSFVRCFCFVCAFSFQGHTKIALLPRKIYHRHSRKPTLTSTDSKVTTILYSIKNKYHRKLLLTYLLWTCWKDVNITQIFSQEASSCI